MSAIETARRLVERLIVVGVTDAVLAPGSRSGPLALALHAADARGLIRLHVRVDEREAAFLALGLAKVQGRTVPVVTTSGTAVTNLHPALLEALHAHVPVLAVTADRPARLRGTGANQTTDQREIFPGVPFLDDVDTLATTSGPQHLNVELDEPLVEPVDWQLDATRVPPPEPSALRPVGVGNVRRTVVVAGDGSGRAAADLAESAGWPLLAEPTSGARSSTNAIGPYRLLLQRPDLADRIEQVVSFGHATLSRPVTALLARKDVVVVHVGDRSTFPVPASSNVAFVPAVQIEGEGDPEWLEQWRRAGREAAGAIEDELDGTTTYDVARIVDRSVPDGGLLVVGSSNPIRDLDLVGGTSGDRTVLGNRGLAGIDGLLSTAVGAALAHEFTRAVAFVGDLTFLHGSNGLLIGPDEPRPDLTIVVANDDGGSIFSTLEQGSPEYAAAFERVYATPTGADLAALCAGYRIPHRRVSVDELAAALAAPPSGIEVVEVAVDRASRRDLAARLARAVGV